MPAGGPTVRRHKIRGYKVEKTVDKVENQKEFQGIFRISLKFE